MVTEPKNNYTACASILIGNEQPSRYL